MKIQWTVLLTSVDSLTSTVLLFYQQVIFQFFAASAASGGILQTEYMTFLEQLEKEREEGRAEGRAEERVNTERERKRADELYAENLKLRKQLESLMHK